MMNIRFVPFDHQKAEINAAITGIDNSACNKNNGADTDSNSTNKKAPYTGVFIVNTPAHDHSGISHLAEHMCFRGSAHYPCDHEIFVANALLPLSINATTYASCTYFYVQSEHKRLFTHAIQYLYGGLVNTHYSQCAFEAERSGVLLNELTLLEGNIDYANNIAIRRNDTSPMAYQHAGGFSDSVVHIGLNDLIDYKKTWYDSNRITLLVSGPDTDADEVTSLCKQAIAEVSTEYFDTRVGNDTRSDSAQSVDLSLRQFVYQTSHQPGHQSMSKPLGESVASYVSTWWVPQAFTHNLLELENQVESCIAPFGHFWVDEEVNHVGMVALRLVHNTNATTQARTQAHKKVVSLLTNLNIEAKPRGFSDSKLPIAVQRLISNYQQQANSLHCIQRLPLTTLPFADYLCSVHVSRASMHEGSINVGNTSKPLNNTGLTFTRVVEKNSPTSMLAANFSSLISLDNLPLLPKLLHRLSALSVQNPNEKFQHADNHWVYRVDTQFHDYLIDIMSGASFWLPRTSGECYALGIARFNDHIFIYGAQDRQTSRRESWCEKTLTLTLPKASLSRSSA